jgi:hypothetical protein
MIKNIGIGIAPKIIETNSPAEKVTAQTEPPTESLPQIRSGNTSVVAELQMSTLALRSRLQNELLINESAKLEPSVLTETMKNPSTSLSLDPNLWKESSNPKWTKLPDRNEASKKIVLDKTLSTGSGDDRVDIHMGADGLVHVIVNDKDAWIGTPEQFQSIVIDTGAGNDFVSNTVAGASIVTGTGTNEVTNYASGVSIDASYGRDKISSFGDKNTFTIDNSDWLRSHGNYNEVKQEVHSGGIGSNIESYGDHNLIQTGYGMDDVKSIGNFNEIHTGEHIDEIEVTGSGNRIYGGDDPDEIKVHGQFNYIYGEGGNDHIVARDGGNTFYVGDGDDKIES